MVPEEQPRRFIPSSFFSRGMVRVAGALLLVIAGFGFVTAYFIRSNTDRILEVRKQELIRIVDLGLAAIEPFRDLSGDSSSYQSVEQLRRNGAVTLRDLTYRYRLGDNYLFMLTYDGLILVNPFDREQEFTNQLGQVDARGKAYIQEMIAAAQGLDGGGYVEYYVPRPGLEEPERKISYVVSVPEWDGLIGAGIYLGDLERENRVYLLISVAVLLLVLGVILLIVWMALRPTLRSYQILTRLFETVSRDPESNPDVPLEDFSQGSEPWQLLAGFKQMQDRKQEYKTAFEQATVAERTRLARDLHDAVSQTLFSAGLIADVLPALQQSQPETAAEQAKLLSELVHGAHAELRTLLVELRPGYLVKADLPELLQQLASSVQGRFRIRVIRRIADPGPVRVDVKIAMYRIAQEALHNAVKHSGASEIRLGLGREPQNGWITLCISDNGCGFDPGRRPGGHFGIDGMAERAREVGAEFNLRSEPGEGTEVTVSWFKSGEQPPGHPASTSPV